MSLERSTFIHRPGQIRTVSGDAAGENEFLNAAAHAIGFRDGFHHPRGAGDIDLPHAAKIEHAGAKRIDDKRQMNHGRGLAFAQERDQRIARRLFAEIE